MADPCPNCGFDRMEPRKCHACGMHEIEGTIDIRWLDRDPNEPPPRAPTAAEITGGQDLIGTPAKDLPMCPHCLEDLVDGVAGGLWVCLTCRDQYTEAELAVLSNTLRIRFAVATREIRRHGRPLVQPVLDLVERLARRARLIR